MPGRKPSQRRRMLKICHSANMACRVRLEASARRASGGYAPARPKALSNGSPGRIQCLARDHDPLNVRSALVYAQCPDITV